MFNSTTKIFRFDSREPNSNVYAWENDAFGRCDDAAAGVAVHDFHPSRRLRQNQAHSLRYLQARRLDRHQHPGIPAANMGEQKGPALISRSYTRRRRGRSECDQGQKRWHRRFQDDHRRSQQHPQGQPQAHRHMDRRRRVLGEDHHWSVQAVHHFVRIDGRYAIDNVRRNGVQVRNSRQRHRGGWVGLLHGR